MQYYGTAEQAAAVIVRAFENPNDLPAPLATLFVKCGADVPCRKWSWRNRLLVALTGHADARGFRQWQQVGRWVRKGEKAFAILAPVLKTVRDEEAGKDKEVLIGFRGIPVFGIGQTDGEPLSAAGTETERWVESLPLVEVARQWGLSVEVFDGEAGGRHGFYRLGRSIGLGVRNLSTWAHELVHAADDRAGNLRERGQHWRSETVAQLGAAVLLRLLGHDAEADLGGRSATCSGTPWSSASTSRRRACGSSTGPARRCSSSSTQPPGSGPDPLLRQPPPARSSNVSHRVSSGGRAVSVTPV